MEVILNKRYEMEIVFEGETHTLCNVLRSILMEDETVKAAAYSIDHPIVGEPQLYIRARSPKKSLVKAAGTLIERCDEFRSLIESA
ncbi:DNA-directed RNA polymerase subunit L [Methanothermobacter sp. K4]|uniref:DNA-directed RNA polymerase subunit L n=1 Tax=Methanothermobacter sp. K4 TaxID=2913262 RepID=UPI001EDA8A9B|nr:DNA-directed RNA polymerase subunit L [Methanothermobacter sp. K4]MCG2828035.1 DNA-directed RNA polymerase subunit L [Methanothermobacter sp. K4]